MDLRAPSDGFSTVTEKYLRVASLSIAGYDYLLTLPAEWRFYRSQTGICHLSRSCVLFIAIRYVSILVLVISNVGAFSTSFTLESCRRLFLVAPVIKVIQTMISQIILGMRTWGISGRSRNIKWFLIVLFLVSTTLEWFTNMFHRIPVSTGGNCTVGNISTLTAWLYYVIAMVYDFITLAISTTYLMRYSSGTGRVTGLIRAMMYDGLIYFVALTASNIFNLILYRLNSEEVQSSGVSLGYTVTWIMSQRILIHLHEIAYADTNNGTTNSLVVTQELSSAREVAHAIRSFDTRKNDTGDEFGSGTASSRGTGNNDVELDIRVHVEHSVQVDYPRGHDLRRSMRNSRVRGNGVQSKM